MTGRLASAIEKTLGNPSTCPHGNPIPNEKGFVAPTKTQVLSDVENGQKVTVNHIPDENAELLRYLSNLGMFPGVRIEVEEKAPFKGPMLVKVGSNSYPLSLDVASGIYVTKEQ